MESSLTPALLQRGVDQATDVLLAHFAARLARYKVPREVRFVASLPRNEQGKLQRRALWGSPPNADATSIQE